jgi:hypothetical protein
LLINQGKFIFDLQALPVEAQLSPIHSIQTLDYNNDGKTDILLAGNFYEVLPEIGRYDASYGLILQGTGKGTFEAVLPRDSGFSVKGQVRAIREIRGANNQQLIILAKNNDSVQVYSYKKPLVQ